MQLRGTSLATVLAACVLSCASVYDYRYSASAPSASDVQSLALRLGAVLEAQGFARLSLEKDEPIPQSGDTGYHSCRDARDLVVFLREASGGTTSVHLFACHGVPRFVLLADSWTRDEPSTTRDLLSREFAAELDSGAVELTHRHRLALE
jgi:hypothetical protein